MTLAEDLGSKRFIWTPGKDSVSFVKTVLLSRCTYTGCVFFIKQEINDFYRDIRLLLQRNFINGKTAKDSDIHMATLKELPSILPMLHVHALLTRIEGK